MIFLTGCRGTRSKVRRHDAPSGSALRRRARPPSPPIPSDAPLGDFLVFEYVTDANFTVNGDTNVPEARFECAVRPSITDERNGHLINISVQPDSWNSDALSTSSDVSACSWDGPHGLIESDGYRR
jgi:hypothetical protein